MVDAADRLDLLVAAHVRWFERNHDVDSVDEDEDRDHVEDDTDHVRQDDHRVQPRVPRARRAPGAPRGQYVRAVLELRCQRCSVTFQAKTPTALYCPGCKAAVLKERDRQKKERRKAARHRLNTPNPVHEGVTTP